jgi:hypothetical protein
MSFQINEKLKFHHSEITTAFGLNYVRGIPVDIHWIAKEPAKYETYFSSIVPCSNVLDS